MKISSFLPKSTKSIAFFQSKASFKGTFSADTVRFSENQDTEALLAEEQRILQKQFLDLAKRLKTFAAIDEPHVRLLEALAEAGMTQRDDKSLHINWKQIQQHLGLKKQKKLTPLLKKLMEQKLLKRKKGFLESRFSFNYAPLAYSFGAVNPVPLKTDTDEIVSPSANSLEKPLLPVLAETAVTEAPFQPLHTLPTIAPFTEIGPSPIDIIVESEPSISELKTDASKAEWKQKIDDNTSKNRERALLSKQDAAMLKALIYLGVPFKTGSNKPVHITVEHLQTIPELIPQNSKNPQSYVSQYMGRLLTEGFIVKDQHPARYFLGPAFQKLLETSSAVAEPEGTKAPAISRFLAPSSGMLQEPKPLVSPMADAWKQKIVSVIDDNGGKNALNTKEATYLSALIDLGVNFPGASNLPTQITLEMLENNAALFPVDYDRKKSAYAGLYLNRLIKKQLVQMPQPGQYFLGEALTKLLNEPLDSEVGSLPEVKSTPQSVAPNPELAKQPSFSDIQNRL